MGLGEIFIRAAIAIGIGLVAINFLAVYWYFVLLGLGALIVLYAHFLGSIRGRRRTLWRRRFGLVGSAVWAAGAIGWIAVASAAPALHGLAFMGLGLAAVHAAGWLLMQLADMLSAFLSEDGLPPGTKKLLADQETALRAEFAERQRAWEADLARLKREWQAEKDRHGRGRNTGAFQGSVRTEKQALEVLGLPPSFTLDQLQKRRMELLKKVHPDQGGSNLMARLVQESYELLKARP